MLAFNAEHTRPEWHRELPADEWHAAQETWVASWEGAALKPGGERGPWWVAQKQAFSKLLKRAKRDLGASTLAAGDSGVSTAPPVPAVPRFELRKRLKSTDKWVSQNAPRLSGLDASTPVPSPEGRHATRTIQASQVTPRGGNLRLVADEVNPQPLNLASTQLCHRHLTLISVRVQVCYTLPPPEGESSHAALQREGRHDRRERATLRRLNDSQHVAAEFAAALQAAIIASSTSAGTILLPTHLHIHRRNACALPTTPPPPQHRRKQRREPIETRKC